MSDLTYQKKIAAQIRALLAKTQDRGATEAEALLAAAKAQELLEKYQIDLDEVALRAEGLLKGLLDRNPIRDDLCVQVAEYTDAVCYVSGGKLCFLGLRSDCEFAVWLIKALEDFIRAKGLDFSLENGPQELKNFWAGATRRISSRLRYATDERRGQDALAALDSVSKGTRGALMIVKGQMLSDELKKIGFRSGEVSYRTTRDSSKQGEAFRQGQAAGNKAGFGRPLASGNQTKGLLT